MRYTTESKENETNAYPIDGGIVILLLSPILIPAEKSTVRIWTRL